MALSPDKLRRLREARTPATGNKVALAIELAKVTQNDVAEGTGLTQPYISDVVRGRYGDITVTNGGKLSTYFGCAIEDLFPTRTPTRTAVSA